MGDVFTGGRVWALANLKKVKAACWRCLVSSRAKDGDGAAVRRSPGDFAARRRTGYCSDLSPYAAHLVLSMRCGYLTAVYLGLQYCGLLCLF